VTHRAKEQAFPVRENEYRATPGLTVREHFALELLKGLGAQTIVRPGRPNSNNIDTPDGRQTRAEWALEQADELLAVLENNP
jgi:hypothetical protein